MSELHVLPRPMTVTVHGELGLVEGEVVAIDDRRLRFWCREDLVLGARNDLRVDVGMNRGNADLEVVILQQEGPAGGRRRGFLHLASWRPKSAGNGRRLAEAVRAQLPEVWLQGESAPGSPRPQAAAPPPPAPASPPARAGLDVTIEGGSVPSVAVMMSTPGGLRTGLRLRGDRAVARVGRPAGIAEHDRVLLVLRLPDGTFHQSMATVTRGRGSLFVRSDPLPKAACIHIARSLASVGVS
jgi:hypothetical protein